MVLFFIPTPAALLGLWTLRPRFSSGLSPRSIFQTAQRFLLPNHVTSGLGDVTSGSGHVTSGCMRPRFYPMVSGFEPAIPLATHGPRLHFRLATTRTNQKPGNRPNEPPLLLIIVFPVETIRLITPPCSKHLIRKRERLRPALRNYHLGREIAKNGIPPNLARMMPLGY